MKQCPQCNTENSATIKFCGECGTKLPNDQPKAANFSPSIGNDAMVSGDISMVGKQETVHAQSYVVHNYQDAKATSHNKCVLKIFADLSCKVYVDNKYYCDVEKEEVVPMPLIRGIYLLKFVSKENEEDIYSCEYDLSESGKLLKVSLKEKQEERERKEKERKERERIEKEKEERLSKGVLINGVMWAQRNVDAPGTFAKTPEDAGKFYQWNRIRAWNTTDEEVSGWDDTDATGITWEKTNDPSPTGWRVPTKEELEKLCDETKVKSEWIEQNGVCGRKFTDLSNGNTIFLLAAGFRSGSDGSLRLVGASGDYWGSTRYRSENAQKLWLGSGGVGVLWNLRTDGFSVRCVLD